MDFVALRSGTSPVNWVQNVQAVSAKQFGADPSFGGQVVQNAWKDLVLFERSDEVRALLRVKRAHPEGTGAA
jgi:hypothetical protein